LEEEEANLGRKEVKVELGDNITNIFLLGEQATHREFSSPFLIVFVYTFYFTY
jgi:hypothetical protein